MGAVAFVLGASVDAEGRTRCSYVGAPASTLIITATGDALTQFGRSGDQILVREAGEGFRSCTGGAPTVFNTDTIKVRVRGDDAFAEMHLGGGPLAPGARPEPEGAPEIEVEFRGREAYGIVVGTPATDEFHWGPGGVHAGLNLNPSTAGDRDIDVTLTSGDYLAFLVADGAAGSDAIIPAPGARFSPFGPGVSSDGGRGDDALIAPDSGGSLDGDSGNDVLIGSRSLDFLNGGPGTDRVAGGGGDDVINGGRGRDVLSGGPGGDSITSRDAKRDRVRCGPGRDRVRADPRDRLRACEVISRR